MSKVKVKTLIGSVVTVAFFLTVIVAFLFYAFPDNVASATGLGPYDGQRILTFCAILVAAMLLFGWLIERAFDFAGKSGLYFHWGQKKAQMIAPATGTIASEDDEEEPVFSEKEEARPYFDPLNHMSEPDLFQYLDISTQVNVSIEQMRKYLTSKGILSGHEEIFLNAAESYGVNAIYLAVHASLETGNGTSPLGTGIIVDGVKVYNMYGIGALDGRAVETGSKMAKRMGWTSPEKAIDGGANWIANHFIKAKQNTLYKMRWNPEKPGTHQYATAANWALAQTKSLKRECDLFPDVTLPLDIPVYKK